LIGGGNARARLNDVAITGLGVVSPHGDDVQAMFAALMRGESAIRPVFPELAKPAVAALAPFDASRWFTKLQLVGVDRVSQMAVAAADLAVTDAGGHDGIEPSRLGVYVGCGLGGMGSLDAAYHAALQTGGRVPPLTIPALMANAPAAHVAMRHGARGPVLTYSVACASSAVALSEAAKAVACGDVDMAVAGGSEAIIVSGSMMAWQAMQTLAAVDPAAPGDAVRPFDLRRSGFALGEGAAFVVLERTAQAKGRGASVYSLLSGWGLSCDATHLTKPDAAGQAKALSDALRRAGLSPADVGYVNAHGTATRVGDVVECEALAAVWGADLQALRVSSTKALHGHLLGGAGALEAVITVLALQHRRAPPNAHCQQQDPACAVALVPDGGTDLGESDAAICSSFAFGGSNSVLLFTRS
jgi:3-oxoacyl-[acyl-carrier-protein] synthase II